MYKYLFGILIILFASACKKKEPRTSLIGSWNVTEVNEMSGLQRTYIVNIEKDPVNTENYKIHNFHNMGNSQNIYALFYINDEGELILENQIEGSFAWIEGTGVVEPDYAQISWDYRFNDVVEQNIFANYY